MPERTLTHQPWRIAAIFWTGHNFPEVQAFFREHIGSDEETGVRNEPDEGWPTGRYAYNTVQFEYGDDLEVDDGRWIVVHLDIPADQDISHERVEIMDTDALQRGYVDISAIGITGTLTGKVNIWCEQHAWWMRDQIGSLAELNRYAVEHAIAEHRPGRTPEAGNV